MPFLTSLLLTYFVLSNKQFHLALSISCHLHERFNFGQHRICKALRTLYELSENRLGNSPLLIYTSRTFHQCREIMLLQSQESHWGHLQSIQELQSNRGTQGAKRSQPELHAVGNTGRKQLFRAEPHPCLDQGRMQSQSPPTAVTNGHVALSPKGCRNQQKGEAPRTLQSGKLDPLI
jgi:hypothetical protein